MDVIIPFHNRWSVSHLYSYVLHTKYKSWELYYGSLSLTRCLRYVNEMPNECCYAYVHCTHKRNIEKRSSEWRQYTNIFILSADSWTFYSKRMLITPFTRYSVDCTFSASVRSMSAEVSIGLNVCRRESLRWSHFRLLPTFWTIFLYVSLVCIDKRITYNYSSCSMCAFLHSLHTTHTNSTTIRFNITTTMFLCIELHATSYRTQGRVE